MRNIQREIQDCLDRIEEQYDVKILLAVESGSRNSSLIFFRTSSVMITEISGIRSRNRKRPHRMAGRREGLRCFTGIIPLHSLAFWYSTIKRGVCEDSGRKKERTAKKVLIT